jgi:GTP-binding protein HflX
MAWMRTAAQLQLQWKMNGHIRISILVRGYGVVILKQGLICYLAQHEDEEEIAYDVAELKELLVNIEIEAAAVVVQRRHPDVNFLFGEGKVQEVKQQAAEASIEAVIFNRELSPRQVKALADLFEEVEIWDRTQVVLEIFSRRARSREGKIQVDLASLSYLYPRLLGLGGVLSRLGGGIGTRGPGETKLEVLRRMVRDRIHDLKEEMTAVRRNRALLRQQRQSAGIPVVSLVGYTNTGKSTLLNALSQSNQPALAEDRLFATLDPLSRRIQLPSGRAALLSDTVGFIRHLPQKLKEAFAATLEELQEAGLLLHVIDLTSPYMEQQAEAVDEILGELALDDRPLIRVYNKLDRYEGAPPADGAAVSARTGANLDLLRQLIENVLFPEQELDILVPYDRLNEIGRLRDYLKVITEEYRGDGVQFTLRGRPQDLERLRAHLRAPGPEK